METVTFYEMTETQRLHREKETKKKELHQQDLLHGKRNGVFMGMESEEVCRLCYYFLREEVFKSLGYEMVTTCLLISLKLWTKSSEAKAFWGAENLCSLL